MSEIAPSCQSRSGVYCRSGKRRITTTLMHRLRLLRNRIPDLLELATEVAQSLADGTYWDDGHYDNGPIEQHHHAQPSWWE